MKEAQIITLSTCEVEYIASAVTACQSMWLNYIFSKLNLGKKDSITIYVDSKSTISLTKNPVSHSRSNHINIKYPFIRE